MIVRMSKVEIIGPKELLLELLSMLRDMGICQIEADNRGFLEKGEETKVRSMLLDEKTAAERLYFEELRMRIDELCACLPKLQVRKSYLEPISVIDALSGLVAKHAAFCGELQRKREALCREDGELGRRRAFLGALESLLEGVETRTDLEFIGVTIREPALMERLVQLLAGVTAGRFEIVTAIAEDGAMIGLITTAREMGEKVKRALSEEHVPELPFPASLQELTFPEKIARLRERLGEVGREIAAIDNELEKFGRRWLSIYLGVREWLDERLSLLKATARVHETGMCFFIHGWMPSGDVAALAASLDGRFGGRVVLEEKRILEEDMERAPVSLKNPPYFRPFELFARLLPLPRYTSYDPTTFIALFFPLFFGMMLGDAGHGGALLLLSLIVMKIFKERRNIKDAAQILFISSLYAILFGFFFGEFFGEFGKELFGFRPLVTERRTAIAPMLFFSLSVGVMHVVLGLSLGVFTAMRRKTKKEAFFKLLTIFVILCLVLLVASVFVPFLQGVVKPVGVTLLVAIPLFLVTGGLMAPLEMVKTIGHVVSYVRIMAIGLTCVFLATAANNLAGMTGDIVTGTIVAGLLHGLGIVVGLFSSTIQSLRLHYVEFFSKFMEHGGRKFEPLRK